MTRTDKQRKRLISLLEQLFQLDQPDLDFGFYKIMHAKAGSISEFLQNDLLKIIQDTFGKADEEKIESARLKYEKAIETAIDHGAPDPESTKAVKEAKSDYDSAKNSDANEGEIYEHLYRFFDRYYDNGDFLSRRYFARESGGKAAPYAVPYDGREVFLHWANRDQYYIKTSEHLTNFRFDIAQHFNDEQRALYHIPDELKLNCRIVEASEGEHNNNKVTSNSERFFIIHTESPVEMDKGELVLQFEYRPDENRSGKADKWQEKLIEEAETLILHALTSIGDAEIYDVALRTEVGEDRNKRTLLRKYLNQYTKRNTADYFIHKDLSNFLKRELDFYIKNEIMRLDDIEIAETPQVEAYLAKIKVLRKIAGQLITFLAQLENYQKKLWLKKKFVTDTQYCITLDRIPEKMYDEIATNDAQRAAWVKLFSIDRIDDDLTTPAYSEPLTPAFLKANPFLVLDTAFFSSDFKDALIAEIQGIDDSIDGLLIHSENFQALQLIQEKYQELIKCVYIDPPYNTGPSEIMYKNGYRSSSWLSLVDSRIGIGKNLITKDGLQCITIDDVEYHKLREIVSSHFSEKNVLGTIIIKNNPSGRSTVRGFSISHEYGIFVGKTQSSSIGRLERTEQQRARYNEQDSKGYYEWVNFRKHGGTREDSPKSFYPVYINGSSFRIPEMDWNNETKEWQILTPKTDQEIEILPIDNNGTERRWKWGIKKTRSSPNEFTVRNDQNGTPYLYVKSRMNKNGMLPLTYWDKTEYSATAYGTNYLKSMFGSLNVFSYPKSIHAVMDSLKVMKVRDHDSCLDYFAGSGTTGHAVISLNRKDGGRRKYILVEMGNYFDSVLKPRIQKAIYSDDWKDGVPVSNNGSSHCFRYIRLESYEDTLNNISYKDDESRDKALQRDSNFSREYMLKYWLEFETKDSPSLLNTATIDDPTAYSISLKKPSSDEYEVKPIDLVESFNWFIGLHIDSLDRWRKFEGKFKREPDPELPEYEDGRLTLRGKLKEKESGKWLFRKIEGRKCRTPGNLEDIDRVLVIWRKLTDDQEKDNLMLDEWFSNYRASSGTKGLDVIYVNGSNNLLNQRQDGERWTVHLIEEALRRQMWNSQ